MCQVALEDPATPDYPIPEPEQDVFTTPACVAVATRPDWVDGDLRDLSVEVWLTEDNEDSTREGELIHEGEITFTTGIARVGNYLASDTHELALAEGAYRVRVFREPPGGPAETVRFVLSGS
jgi:hypothetical protein